MCLSHILEPELERLSSAGGGELVADPRSRLQELLQASGRPEPRYEMVGEDGPAHRKSFTMQVVVLSPGNETEFATAGSGNTKKAASQWRHRRRLNVCRGQPWMTRASRPSAQTKPGDRGTLLRRNQ